MKVGRALAYRDAALFRPGPDGAPVVLVDLQQTAPRRHVAAVVGSPLWSAGPSPFYALGALVAALGPRFGVFVLPPADAAPYVRVTRADERPYHRPHAHVVDSPGHGGSDLRGLRSDADGSGPGLPWPGESAGAERAST